MDNLPHLDALIEHLKRLPSVGQKSAERMAQALLTFNDETLKSLGEAISEIREHIHLCPRCGDYCEGELCSFCSDTTRNSDTLIVVSYPKDILGFSKLMITVVAFMCLVASLVLVKIKVQIRLILIS